MPPAPALPFLHVHVGNALGEAVTTVRPDRDPSRSAGDRPCAQHFFFFFFYTVEREVFLPPPPVMKKPELGHSVAELAGV